MGDIYRMLFRAVVLVMMLVPGIRAYSQGSYVFFGSFNRDKTTEGIYVYQLDTLNGGLSKVTTVTGILNPSFLTLSPNGEFIYSCTESKMPHAGSVSSFKFDKDNRTLTYINSQPCGGENPVYVTVHQNGKWLVNGNYTEGSVSVYPLSADGKIAPVAQHIDYTEGSIIGGRQDRAHIHSTVFAPGYDHIFLPDLGADKIRCYQFDSNRAQPLQPASYPFIQIIPGSGPRHFTFHPNGLFAYCIEELSGMVSAYTYSEGRLEPLQRIAAHVSKYKEGFESSDIHVSPDGLFLYASNRGNENNIAIFSIQRNGALIPAGYQSTAGSHPRTFAIDPSGKFLIVVNTISGTVVVFRLNAQTGLLRKTGKKLNIRNVSCVKIRQY